MFGDELKLFRQQKFSFKNAKRRLNLWDGPIRSGKTVVSIINWIDFIGRGPEGDYLMTGKTNGSLYRNIIRPMQELVGNDMRYGVELDTRVINMWGRKIWCIGANDERAEAKIRGSTIAGAYGDEVTLWPESYFSMMIGRMSVLGARFFGTTNPDNPQHWLKKKYIDRKNELGMNVFNWTIDANINLPREYVEAIKREYIGLFYKRYILGQWCLAEGAIYDFFDEKIHVIDKAPKAKYYYVSVDYGTSNPTSFGLYGVNLTTTPRVWRERGYWWDSKKEGRQKTDAEYSKDMKEFLGDINPRAIIVDPSAASFKNQLSKDHNYYVKDADNEVLDGIRVQSRMLKNKEYAIVNHQTNRECLDEYYGYVWDDKAVNRGEDKPLKERDHTKDEERYLLKTEFDSSLLDYTILTKY